MNLSPSIPWSHQVGLFDESGVEFPCVGTILSSYLILTLASCLYGKVEHGSAIRTKGAASEQFHSEEEEEEENRKIIRIIYHPVFSLKSSKNDLAILVLDQDLNVNWNDNSTAEAIPLFPMIYPNKTRNESTFLNFSGFSCGEDSSLSPLEISHPVKCPYSSYKSDKMCLLPANSNFNSNETNSSGGNCRNPLPGSSLFCSDEERGGFLCGILAVSPENLGESPRIYTNITQHLKWIQFVKARANKTNELTGSEGEMESEGDAELNRISEISGLAATVLNGVSARSPIPYQLSLQYETKDGFQHWCGAVILDKNTAVTAAHCVYTKQNWTLYVVAGTTDRSESDQKYPVRRVIIHPDYSDFTNGSDIAILHVDTMYFYQQVQAAWLPPFSSEKLSNMTAVISGWGHISNDVSLPNSLQMGKVSIMSPKDCLYQLKTFIGVNVREGVVCALDEQTRTCGGDSGGPLVIQNYTLGNSVGNLLVRLTSFGPSGCAPHNATGVFTEVSHFYNWIQENRFAKPCDGVEDVLPCISTTRKCYHKDWACDGDWDCPDGTDEINCPKIQEMSSTNETDQNLLGYERAPRQILGKQDELQKRDPLMKLFATLKLPHSVMKHESFDLQVNVHNNLGYDVNVWVTLFGKYNNSDFAFVDSRSSPKGYETAYITANKIHGGVAHFTITPSVAGDIPIKVKVITDDGTAADLLIRPLKVKPEGVKQRRSQLFIFSNPINPNANQTRKPRFEVKFPEKHVRGANSVQLTVVGDAAGVMVSNLAHFSNLPTTNGEQNMMKFVPNVLALDYLNASNLDAKEIVPQAKKNLLSSYARQLPFRNKDGSFSISKSEKGSTWLTSQVLWWIVAAQKHVRVHEEVIQGAVNFTLSRQQKDGSFLETGPVYHSRLGGLNDTEGVALTAYITLALIKAHESSTNDLNLSIAIEKGMRFISQESVYQFDDSYITNLVAATLTAGNHPEKNRFFEKMEKRAKNITTRKLGTKLKYWNMINGKERVKGPLAIEMTSYALLAHLWKEGEKDSSVFFIYNWLLKQQNPQGGFISTQDSVLGLTALTEYALKKTESVPSQEELQLKIRASSKSAVYNDTEYPVTVAHRNRMVLQKFKLARSTKTVEVEARGNGTALIQMTESWYVPKTSKSSPHFNITANMTCSLPKYPEEAELEVCVSSVHPSGFNRSSVASVQLPSGYSFYSADFEDDSYFMREKPKNAQRFDVAEGDTKVDVYLATIPNDPPTCVTFPTTRLILMANLKNGSVSVYETADPDVQGAITYSPAHIINACQLCQVTHCDMEGCKDSKNSNL